MTICATDLIGDKAGQLKQYGKASRIHCASAYTPMIINWLGFARVISDFTIFAYLLDLFILEGHRKCGLGKWFIEHIIKDPVFKDIRLWRLDTKDAHELYRKYGFREPAFPEKIMEKRSELKRDLPTG